MAKGKWGSAPGPYGTQPALWLLRTRLLTQRELAERLGCSQATVHAVLAGIRRPSPEFVRVTCEVIGLPAAALFTREALS